MSQSQNLSDRATAFLEVARRELWLDDLDDPPPVSELPAVEAERVLIADPAQPTEEEREALSRAFRSRFAMAAFECVKTQVEGDHPLVLLGAGLYPLLPTKWPIARSPERRSVVTEIRDIGVANQGSRSLTNEAMAAHQDGWLSLHDEDRGALAVTSLWADSVPEESAATFSQNIVLLALDLRQRDPAAFVSLFADDAVRIVDRAGETAAQSPVLFLKRGVLHSFYRGANDEYDVRPGGNEPAATRAIEFLNSHTGFGANGSIYTRLDRAGRGLFLNNRYCVHGRTAFRDGNTPQNKRIIASKWWASHDEDRDLSWE
jgi:hypothetical protein